MNAEGERCADEHDECAGIHRMPHERVRTGGNDRLAFGNLNRGGAVAVFPEHEEDEQKSVGDMACFLVVGAPCQLLDSAAGIHVATGGSRARKGIVRSLPSGPNSS